MISLFVSYSHVDEWLKDELKGHLAALERKGEVFAWHDRVIPAGSKIHDKIDSAISDANIFLFLISNDFISSDYCMSKEYGAATNRYKRGEVEIIPVIVRECDWDVDDLKSFAALPKDAQAVTKNAFDKTNPSLRDGKWLEVVNGLKVVLEDYKKKLQAPKLRTDYAEALFVNETIHHPLAKRFNENDIFVDPDIYHENQKGLLTSFPDFLRAAAKEKVSIISGPDRSGKTLILKQIQHKMAMDDKVAVILNGNEIKNIDVERYIRLAMAAQFEESSYPISKITVLIDNFDDCRLNDSLKETVASRIVKACAGSILTSFSTAPSVLYASMTEVSPALFAINQLDDAKIYKVVQNWLRIGLPDSDIVPESECLATYEKIMYLFGQSELERSPYAVVRWVELLQTAGGGDIAVASYAAAYDSLINNRLSSHVDVKRFDEIKNFMSLVSYEAFLEDNGGIISREKLNQCLEVFATQYLSDKNELEKIAFDVFLNRGEDGPEFVEDYIWYFLCARYASKELYISDKQKFYEFIDKCSSNIFVKKYANIVIYAAYFCLDSYILDSLLKTLDILFSKADDWRLSDKAASLMLGIVDEATIEAISSSTDNTQDRLNLLSHKIVDVINEAESMVAKYTLPFLNADIEDSECVDNIDNLDINTDSYMKNANALFRLHSVIGQILSTRSGTFSAPVLVNCIERMVKASGRFSYLNHAIAAVIIYDKENNADQIDKAIVSEALSIGDKYNKIMRLFSFWAVYMSQAGLARYLGQDHSIRALERLVSQYENLESKDELGYIPFNFTSVLAVAKIYHFGKIDTNDIDAIFNKYGSDSAIIAILRTTIRIYSYYMPLSYQDKQWVAQRFKMPLLQVELPSWKASKSPTNVAKKKKGALLDKGKPRQFKTPRLPKMIDKK
jgi:hypothetical protein